MCWDDSEAQWAGDGLQNADEAKKQRQLLNNRVSVVDEMLIIILFCSGPVQVSQQTKQAVSVYKHCQRVYFTPFHNNRCSLRARRLVPNTESKSISVKSMSGHFFCNFEPKSGKKYGCRWRNTCLVVVTITKYDSYLMSNINATEALHVSSLVYHLFVKLVLCYLVWPWRVLNVTKHCVGCDGYYWQSFRNGSKLVALAIASFKTAAMTLRGSPR